MREAGRNPGLFAGGGGASSIRRIQRELKEILEAPSKHWTAAPVADDLFEWQFTIRGPPATDFQGGIYTGRLVLPVNYPLAPPSITMLTPSGRWEVGKKICLSNSNYHPELWQPAWGIRTMMEALRSHFPHPGDGAIGALDWPSELRQKLAVESLDFVCPPGTKTNRELLPVLTAQEALEEDVEPSVPVAQPAEEQLLDEQPSVSEPAQAPAPAPAPVVPEGLRQRSVEVDTAPAVAAVSSSSGALLAPPTPVAVVPARRSRREDGSAVRPQRRQQPVFLQLLKPPQTKRSWVLLVINLLLCLLAVSFTCIMTDIIKHPPLLLDPLPDAQMGAQNGNKGD